jgi:hypothetical protein
VFFFYFDKNALAYYNVVADIVKSKAVGLAPGSERGPGVFKGLFTRTVILTVSDATAASDTTQK